MKRYIRSAKGDSYSVLNDTYHTSFIDEATPASVIALEDIDLDTDDILDVYRKLKAAVDDFKSDYKKFGNQDHIDSLDSKYDLDKGRFYLKYLPLFDKCKELKNLSVSGYGQLDFVKNQINRLTKFIDWNYPHGWKTFRIS